jgi:hypothetical protein
MKQGPEMASKGKSIYYEKISITDIKKFNFPEYVILKLLKIVRNKFHKIFYRFPQLNIQDDSSLECSVKPKILRSYIFKNLKK